MTVSMNLRDVLAECAEAVANADGCTISEAYGKLATTCLRLGGYEAALALRDRFDKDDPEFYGCTPEECASTPSRHCCMDEDVAP